MISMTSFRGLSSSMYRRLMINIYRLQSYLLGHLSPDEVVRLGLEPGVFAMVHYKVSSEVRNISETVR